MMVIKAIKMTTTTINIMIRGHLLASIPRAGMEPSQSVVVMIPKKILRPSVTLP